MYARNILAAGAILLITAFSAAANAAIIYPVSATGSSSYPGYPDADAIDIDVGADYSDWASFGGGDGSFLNLDLGAVYTLSDAVVTDRVTSGGGNGCPCFGTTDFTTRFSLQAFNDLNFTSPGALQVFNHTTPVSPSSPADFRTTVALGGLTTRYLRYQVLTHNGARNPGLSDIHFSGAPAAVPEPTAWVLMITGFGAAGAMLRRRRQVLVRA